MKLVMVIVNMVITTTRRLQVLLLLLLTTAAATATFPTCEKLDSPCVVKAAAAARAALPRPTPSCARCFAVCCYYDQIDDCYC